MKKFSLIVLALLTLAFRAAADANVDFDAANKLYAQGKFAEAAAAYEKISASGATSAALCFNLGNAQFKTGQLGRAIAAYRRASSLAPRDPDIRANLGFARNHVSGSDAPHASLLQRAFGTLTLNEWTTLAALALWAWFITLAMREWKPALREKLRAAALWTGVAFALLATGTAATLVLNHSAKSAVVIAKDAAVKTGPLDDSQNAFNAKDGAELTVLDERDDWLQVTDPRNRLGWIKRDAVQVL